jgi:hypothetical protein
MKDKTIDELDVELCEHCLLDEDKRGVKGGPNGPIYLCGPAMCENAYKNYLDELKENN